MKTILVCMQCRTEITPEKEHPCSPRFWMPCEANSLQKNADGFVTDCVQVRRTPWPQNLR